MLQSVQSAHASPTTRKRSCQRGAYNREMKAAGKHAKILEEKKHRRLKNKYNKRAMAIEVSGRSLHRRGRHRLRLKVARSGPIAAAMAAGATVTAITAKTRATGWVTD